MTITLKATLITQLYSRQSKRIVNSPSVINKATPAVIRDGKLLLVREINSQEVFLALGGTAEPGES